MWPSKLDFSSQGYHWVSLEPQEQGGKIQSTNDNFLTYAMWGNLEQYLKLKTKHLTERIAREKFAQDPRCILRLAVAPRDPPSLINYTPIGDRLGLDQCSSKIVSILLQSGCDPAQPVGAKTVWEMMICWQSRLSAKDARVNLSYACPHDANYMNIMRAMIEHGANPNIVGAHMCSLLFMAATCADISIPSRRDLIELLLQKGAELFPGESTKLSEIISWTDVNSWPVLEEEVHAMLVTLRAGPKEYLSDVENTVAARTVEEIREDLGVEKFFTPMSSPVMLERAQF
jgi:hypothetical protein